MALRQGSPAAAVAPVEVRTRQESEVRSVGGRPAGASREQDKDPDWACGAPWGLAGLCRKWGRVGPRWNCRLAHVFAPGLADHLRNLEAAGGTRGAGEQQWEPSGAVIRGWAAHAAMR
ncbi:hypothetical protein NDU88_005380 [Pleurodeles waltl]|uniref:Uncharacterized protein n=1 Tax=Pleurodeles waltl TaxID=8319 RepID=A0AAV7MCP2_PLEWA|nr:hypothetical protein NDU88_005380 [Pleurodeles waltl]